MKLKIYMSMVLATFMSACSGSLDLVPLTDKAAVSFFSSEAEIESAINGVYGQLQNPGLYGLDLIGVGEVSGEDTFEEIAANDGGRFGQLDDFSTNPQNDLVGDIWRESYEGIQRVNVILNRIEAISFANPTVKTTRTGEMKFIRGLLYFNLVRLYGDVPLVLEETANPSDYFGIGRTPAAQVWAQIETDLSDAIAALPQAKTSGRPAKGAAQALLADVQMNQGNYTSAVSSLAGLISSQVYALVPSTSDVFSIANEGNKEVVFEIKFTSGINGNKEGSPVATQFRPSGTVANAKGHNLPNTDFVNTFDPMDTRKTAYVGRSAANPFYYSTKYEVSPTGVNDSGSDYYVIRYADVLLKYAEALNETGKPEAAAVYLNQVRNRAGLPDVTVVNQAQIREAIDMERRFEFIGEGHRWFDLLRTGTAVATMNEWFAANGKSVVIDATNLLLPIPQSQIDTDPAIVQNAGY